MTPWRDRIKQTLGLMYAWWVGAPMPTNADRRAFLLAAATTGVLTAMPDWLMPTLALPEPEPEPLVDLYRGYIVTCANWIYGLGARTVAPGEAVWLSNRAESPLWCRNITIDSYAEAGAPVYMVERVEIDGVSVPFNADAAHRSPAQRYDRDDRDFTERLGYLLRRGYLVRKSGTIRVWVRNTGRVPNVIVGVAFTDVLRPRTEAEARYHV